MSIRKPFLFFQLAIAMLGGGHSQEIPQRYTPTSTPERVVLGQESTVQTALPAKSIGPPIFCGADGDILLRLAMPDTGVEDPISISADGKTITHFGREKIRDIANPVLESMFLRESDLYILTRGATPLGYNTKWRTPSGEVITQQAAKSELFIAHFKSDGTYDGAVRLDLPFHPLQLGAFEDGAFLVAGVDPTRTLSRAAIVGSDGQLLRILELNGDVHTQDEEVNVPEKSKDRSALPRFASPENLGESFFDVVSVSQIVSDGPNLILFRPSRAPVFSISRSGEVKALHLTLEGDYSLYTIKPSRSGWITELIRELPNSTQEEFATLAFSSDTGALLREYSVPDQFGFGLACTDGNEFTFVVADQGSETLELVKLHP